MAKNGNGGNGNGNGNMTPNEHRQDMTTRMSILETKTSGIRQEISGLAGRFDEFTKQISEWRQNQGRPNWQVIIGFFGTVLTAGGILITTGIASLSVFWFMINSQVGSFVNPVKSDVAALSVQSSINTQLLNNVVVPRLTALASVGEIAGQAQKSTDGRVDRILDRVGQAENRIVANIEALSEIEAQFKATDNIRNVQFSEQQRANSVMWNSLSASKAPLPPYPSAPFYQPQIARDPHDGNVR